MVARQGYGLASGWAVSVGPAAGPMLTVRKAKIVRAQLVPRLCIIGLQNKGKTAPKMERRTELAARAEAAYIRYASTR